MPKCNITTAPEGQRPCRPLTIGVRLFSENPTCAPTVRKGAHKSGPKRSKVPLWAPKGGKWTPNGAKKEAKGWPTRSQNRPFTKKCRKCFGPIIYYILSTFTVLKMLTFPSPEPPKMHVGRVPPLFRSTGSTFGATVAQKWREWGPLGVRMRPKASKIPPKIH